MPHALAPAMVTNLVYMDAPLYCHISCYGCCRVVSVLRTTHTLCVCFYVLVGQHHPGDGIISYTRSKRRRECNKNIKKKIYRIKMLYIFFKLYYSASPYELKTKKMPPTPASRAHRRAQTPVVTQCCRSCSTQSAHVV